MTKMKYGVLIIVFLSGLHQLSQYHTTFIYYISNLLGVIFSVIVINYIWDYFENRNKKMEE